MKTPPPDLADKLYKVSEEFLAPDVELRIDDLAAAADIPRATLYYYFAGRDDVIAFLLEQKLERGLNRLEKALAEGGSPTRRLDAALRAILHAIAESPSLCTKLMAYLSGDASFTSLRMSAERRLQAPLRAVLTEGVDVGELATPDPAETVAAFTGAISTVAMMHVLATGSLDADGVADRLIPQLMGGIKT